MQEKLDLLVGRV